MFLKMRTLKKKTKIRSSLQKRGFFQKPAEAKVHAEQILALKFKCQPDLKRESLTTR
jgi:hypothetical protein